MNRLNLPPRPAIGSWPGGWTVRRVTADDIRALLGGDMDQEYAQFDPVGYAAEHNGVLIATGSVNWSRNMMAWGWLTCRYAVPARILHTCALEMLAMLRDSGEPNVRMIVNLSIPAAERWARRLGFKPDGDLTHSLGPVYRCDLK